MKRIFYLIVLLSLIFNYHISASCGTASCPLHINNSLLKGLFSLRFSHEYVYQNQIFAGSVKSFVGAIPQHHDEVSTLNQITSFTSVYGISDFLSIDFTIPFIHREHSHIHNHGGEQIWETWNFSGVGDMIFLTNVSLLNNADNNTSLNIVAGIKLQTGVTDAVNQEGEKAEVTLQPGSGSTDFIFSASYSQNILSLPSLSGSTFSAFPVSVNINYKVNNKGTDDYRFGNELFLHLSTAYRFIEKAALLLQVNAKFQDKADVGLTGEPQENTGGKWVYVSPGLKFYLTETFSVYSYFQLPVYQNVNGIQQVAPYNLQFSIQHEINLFD